MPKRTLEHNFEYPSYIMSAILQLMEKSTQKDKAGLLSQRTDVVDLLFNIYTDYPITEQIYNLMWHWIIRMIGAEHIDWVKHYWSTANQYYLFKLGNSTFDDEKDEFREFNLMVGTLFLNKRNPDLLKYAFYFSNSLPAKFPLVPSTFTEIFHWYKLLSEKNKEMYLLKYCMSKSFDGAGEELKVEGDLIDYLALLMVRLEHVGDYNITFSNPYNFPPTGNTYESIDCQIRMAITLRHRVEKLDLHFILECGLGNNGKVKAQSLLDTYIEQCQAERQRLDNRNDISAEKQDQLKTQLIEASQNNLPNLPVSDRVDEDGIVYDAVEVVQLDERLILAKHDYLSSNIAEALLNALNTMAQHVYSYQFLLNGATYSVAVPYGEFSDVLEKLNLNSEYAIMAMNVSQHFFVETKGFHKDAEDIWKYNDAKVHQISTNRETSLIILYEKDVPAYCINSVPETTSDGETEIDTNNHLYSNIDNLKNDDLKLSVRRSYKFFVPNPLRYVRLRIAMQLDRDDSIVQKLQPIENYIG